MSYDDLVAFALTLEGCEESTYYGGPAIKREGKVMFTLKESGEEVSLRLDWPEHDEWMTTRPDVVYQTPHFGGWPWFLVRLAHLTQSEMELMVRQSYDAAPKKIKLRKGPTPEQYS